MMMHMSSHLRYKDISRPHKSSQNSNACDKDRTSLKPNGGIYSSHFQDRTVKIIRINKSNLASKFHFITSFKLCKVRFTRWATLAHVDSQGCLTMGLLTIEPILQLLILV